MSDSATPNVLSVQVKVDGSTRLEGDNGAVETREGAYISYIQVDQRLDSPDFFSVTYQMMSGADFRLLDCMKPGAEIEIHLGYATEATLFKGEISYVEPVFNAEEHLLTISGYDKIHRLTRGTSSRSWGDGHQVDVDVATIAQEVVAESKARMGDTSDALSTEGGGSASGGGSGGGGADAGGAVPPGTEEAGGGDREASYQEGLYEYVPQVGVNDFEFIRGLGNSLGVDLDSLSSDDSGRVAFAKADMTAEPKVVICRERKDPPRVAHLSLGAEFRLSTVRQVAKVEVRGWNPHTKEPVLGVAESVSEPFDGMTGPASAGNAHYGSSSSGRVLSVIDMPVACQEEADNLAATLFDQQAMDFMTADVTIQGVPDLTAGDVVEVKQFGTRFSGRYLVEAAHHVVVSGTTQPYQTRLKLMRNAVPNP